jgi:hypothetical protein
MASLAILSALKPASGDVNSAPPFKFSSSVGIKRDYSQVPSVAALQNPTLRNNVKEPMVNATARIPIFARPFAREFEKNYSEGDILFVKKDERAASSHSVGHNVVLNLPVLNYMLKTEMEPATEQNENPKHKYKKADDVLADFNYFGIMNNDMDTGSRYQRLLNVNVRGRSRVARYWQPNGAYLQRGQCVWVCLLEKTYNTAQSVQDPNGMLYALSAGTYVEAKCLLDSDEEFATAQVCIPIGCVSQVTLKRPSRAAIALAHQVTEKSKLLERIEVLMRV